MHWGKLNWPLDPRLNSSASGGRGFGARIFGNLRTIFSGSPSFSEVLTLIQVLKPAI